MRTLLSVLLLSGALAASAAIPVHAEPAPFMKAGERLPNGGRPPHRVAFPPIRDWHSLKITLRRSSCFGSCPSYRVEIDGNGHVSFLGERDTAVHGDASGEISRKQVRRLYNAFRKAQFFWLYDSYRAQITDLPEYRVSISYDDHKMEVLDYAGTMIGMPAAVRDLENLIDKTAGTAEWIKPAEPPTPRPTGY